MGEFHAQVLSDCDGVDSVVVTDVDNHRAAAVASSVGGDVATNLDSMIEGGVDAIAIAAPTPMHAELIIRGIDAGLPVFCEKPIALDIESTNKVVDRVRELDATVMIGFNRRFDPGFRAVHDVVVAGEVGRVHVARLGTHDPAPPPLDYLRSSGGLFRDMHIHDFDAARFVTGLEVEAVYAAGSVLIDHEIGEIGDVDTTSIVLHFAGGALGTITGCRSNPPGYDVRVEVYGERDAVTAGLDGRTPMRSLEPAGALSGGKGWDFFVDRFDQAYRLQMNAFVELARNGGESPCTVYDGREALLIAMAAEKSLAERRVVPLGEVRSDVVAA
jgi:myo-inositol 2-dehydrogenase/D-chiro-inositol 1-dehydrogenase